MSATSRTSDPRRARHETATCASTHARKSPASASSILVFILIRYMWNKNSLGSEIPIVVFLLRLRIGRGVWFRRLGGQHVDRVLIRRVNIRLRRRNYDLDFVLVRARLHDTEIGRYLVVTLRTPGDIAAQYEYGSREHDDQISKAMRQ